MKVGHSDSSVALQLQHQFASVYKIRPREALERGGYFDSLSDWYCHNILPVPFNLVLFPRLCLFDCLELFRRLFYFFHMYKVGFERLTCVGAAVEGTTSSFSCYHLAGKRSRKLVVLFVTTVLCGLGLVVKEPFGCLTPAVCK